MKHFRRHNLNALLVQVVINPILKKMGNKAALFFEGCLRYATGNYYPATFPGSLEIHILLLLVNAIEILI